LDRGVDEDVSKVVAGAVEREFESLIAEVDGVVDAEGLGGDWAEWVVDIGEGVGRVFVRDGLHAALVGKEVCSADVVAVGVGVDEVLDGLSSDVADGVLQFTSHSWRAVDYDDAFVFGDEDEGLVYTVSDHVGTFTKVVDCITGGVQREASGSRSQRQELFV